MSMIQLPAVPYNEMFISCLHNNLIGILQTFDSSYQELHAEVQHVFTLVRQKPNSSDLSTEYLEQSKREGWFELDLKYRKPDLSKWFEVIDVPLNGDVSPHSAVQNLLHDGFYAFMNLDRFHFPGGVDYQLRNRIHPTFFHGFDEANGSYNVLEDCVHPGKMEPYLLNIECFDESYASVQQKNRVKCTGYRVKTELISTYEMDPERIRLNLRTLLEERVQEAIEPQMIYPGLYRNFGLSSLSAYAETMRQTLPSIARDELHHLFIPLSRTVQVHTRNLKLIQQMQANGYMSDVQAGSLRDQALKLHNQWEMYRNRMFMILSQLMEEPMNIPSEKSFDRVRKMLQTIQANEIQFSTQFLEAL